MIKQILFAAALNTCTTPDEIADVLTAFGSRFKLEKGEGSWTLKIYDALPITFSEESLAHYMPENKGWVFIAAIKTHMREPQDFFEAAVKAGEIVIGKWNLDPQAKFVPLKLGALCPLKRAALLMGLEKGEKEGKLPPGYQKIADVWCSVLSVLKK